LLGRVEKRFWKKRDWNQGKGGPGQCQKRQQQTGGDSKKSKGSIRVQRLTYGLKGAARDDKTKDFLKAKFRWSVPKDAIVSPSKGGEKGK